MRQERAFDTQWYSYVTKQRILPDRDLKDGWMMGLLLENLE
jgi:hypothetical protein